MTLVYECAECGFARKIHYAGTENLEEAWEKNLEPFHLEKDGRVLCFTCHDKEYKTT